MSPIMVRPVREQLDHDRIIRLLQARFRRRFEVGINPGHEQNAPVGSGPAASYPDVVLLSSQRGRRLAAVIEVETTESVNHLEAIAQWVRLSRLRAPFHLYVPASSVDVARRLCTDHAISVAEVVSYHTVGDQMRFTTVYRAPAETRRARTSRAGTGTRPRQPVARAGGSRSAGASAKTRKPSRTAKRK